MKKLIYLSAIMLSVTLASCSSDNAQENSLLVPSKAPFGAPEFNNFKSEDYKPAIIKGIEEQRAAIDAIVANSEAPTFENTIEALELSGETLSRVGTIFFALVESDADSIMRETEIAVTPLYSDLQAYMMMNDGLFQRVKTLYDNKDNLNLTTEQAIVLDNYYKDFVRGGALLDADKKKELAEINKQLDLARVDFGNNLLAENKAFKLTITDEKNLSGLPQDIRDAAKETAQAAGVEGWVFTLDKPSLIPFLQYADNRDLREQMYKAYYQRGNNNNANDNKAVIKHILELRLKKAQLLGFNTYADFMMDNKMAKTPQAALDLMYKLWKPALRTAKVEAYDLQQMINKEGGKFQLEAWDWWYYTEKLRQEKYDLDENEYKPYFPADQVRQGTFACAEKLYGISFKELTDVPVYHPTVKAYEVLNNDSTHLALFYEDCFPRDTKRAGAWMTVFQDQKNLNGVNQRPFVVNVCNFTPATGETPSLLNVDEIETMFHEFGHALHGMLTQCHYPSVSGTSVKQDFVELFSQINEHWAFEPEVLKMYAKHYQTGEVIPDDLVKKMQDAMNFNQGFITTELVAAAMLDMEMHRWTDYSNFDVDAFEESVSAMLGMMPEITFRYRTTNFNHIFSSGYAVGYYAYLWAEVLDADGFELFKEKGIFDAETAKAFRHLLESGGSEDPMEMYVKFRGAQPNPDALLRGRGLLK